MLQLLYHKTIDLYRYLSDDKTGDRSLKCAAVYIRADFLERLGRSVAPMLKVEKIVLRKKPEPTRSLAFSRCVISEKSDLNSFFPLRSVLGP